jgi:hypothetical protein
MTRDELILILDGMHDKMEFLRTYFKKEEEKEKKKKEFWAPEYSICRIKGSFSKTGKICDSHFGVLKEVSGDGKFVSSTGQKWDHFLAPVQTVDNCTVKKGSLCKFWNPGSDKYFIGYFIEIFEGTFRGNSWNGNDEGGWSTYNMEPIIETSEDGKPWDAI